MTRANSAGRDVGAANLPADVWFFPAAALHAIAAVALWAGALAGWTSAPRPYWHAHEMLFGYALLVVGGYLIGRARPALLAAVLSAWLVARIAPWALRDGAAVAAIAQLVFSVTVATRVAWPFIRAAKKAQNRVFGPLFLLLCACDVAYQVGAWSARPALESRALLIGVDLYALLLAMMGGRILPAAVAGHYYRSGRVLEDRVQPALEKTVIALLVAMIALDLAPAASAWAGGCALAAALFTAARAYRWRLWTVLDTPHLASLGLGYLWLVPGLALKGHAQLAGHAPSDALHALTIGALGTLTLVMMGRTRLQRSRRSLERFGDVAGAAVLIGVSALARLAMRDAGEDAMTLVGISAAAWIAAFALLLRLLLSRRPA